MKFKILVIMLTVALLIFSGCNTKEDPAYIPKATSGIESKVLHSEALKKDMNVKIYLPKGYSKKEKYPVLYLIHGFNGKETGIYVINTAADNLLYYGKINPLIIVAPAVDNSYGINSSQEYNEITIDEKTKIHMGMYEDYLYKEVVSYIDSNYSTIQSREGRYIGGISMGGYIALHIGFTHSDMFSKVGGHEPALFMDDIPDFLKNMIYPSEELRKERDPLYIAKNKDLSDLDIYLDDGKTDSYGFYKGCEALYNTLTQKGAKVQYHLNEGGHDNVYVQNNVEKYLLFYAGKK